jgi:hypothetical protein
MAALLLSNFQAPAVVAQGNDDALIDYEVLQLLTSP